MRTGGQEENLVRLGEVVVGAALKVHSRLGPGLLEGIYETCLIHELRTQGLTVESQRVLPVIYEGLVLHSAFRLDVLVDNQVVLEVKAVDPTIANPQSAAYHLSQAWKLSIGLPHELQ
jgi:GxxExxY protein